MDASLNLTGKREEYQKLNENPPPAARRTVTLIVAIFAGVVIMVVAAGFVAWHTTRAAVESAFHRAIAKHEETVDLSSLVTQVRELNRLETASMHVMHVSTTTQTYNIVPDALGGDELTLLAAGDVIAGVDLSLLKKDDVWREPDGTIVMRLPPSQVLVTRVDNKESHVINRKTGLLRRADINMESRARLRAEAEIRNEAVRKGILNLASRNAQAKLAEFLHSTGVQKVKFVGQGARSGAT